MNTVDTIGTPDTTDTTENIPAATVIPQQKMYSADLLKAHVALMEKEVILPKQVDVFRLVNRHYRALQTWHDQNTGWRVQRGPTAIRLIRHLSATTPGYLYERLKEPNDFACLTWILWYAENRQLTGRGNDQQFLLSQLAESIQEQSTSATTGEAQFDFRRQNDRYSIQRALQTLENLGGLQLVDGQTREWVEQSPDADVLYEFTDVVHALVAALNPQLVTMVAARLHDSATTLQPTRLIGMAETPSDLMRAWRVLLLGPALFRYDDPPAFAALVAHADDVANELSETFGWLLDIHRDYACIVRASGMSTGPVTSLTPYGTNDQIAMLLCKAIRGQVEAGTWAAPDAYGCLHVTVEDMTALFYAVRERYGEQWGSEARGKSSRGLLNDVYRKMRQIGLLRGPNDAGNILVLPTAARYTATYDKAEQEIAPGKGQPNKAKSVKAPVKIELPGISTTVKTPVKSTNKKR
jgi:uncharacterized protein (TIGR02678 family)